MRPLRLLLALGSSLVALMLLLYVAFGSQRQEAVLQDSPTTAKPGRLKALFSFTSPGSLFPPSAIISLTDDNSTFFLARPAAFGPLLPTNGLSGPLWIGSDFGDDTMERGELGCSDVPGWRDGRNSLVVHTKGASSSKSDASGKSDMKESKPPTKRTETKVTAKPSTTSEQDDGTDDHLHFPLGVSKLLKSHVDKTSGHADIQSLQEGAEITGKVVLLKRGGCGFLEKVKWTQRRGGVALIVGDDIRGGPLVHMYAHGDTSNVSIPAIFTSHTTAHLLSSLLPSGGLIQDLSPDDVAKLGRGKAAKKHGNKQDKSGKKQNDGGRPASTQAVPEALQTSRTSNEGTAPGETDDQSTTYGESGWFRLFLSALGLGKQRGTTSADDSRRPPSSGNLDWFQVEDWDDDQKPMRTKPVSSRPASTQATDDFVIGEQDWRDPDLLPQSTATITPPKESVISPDSSHTGVKGGSVLPGSGEYLQDGKVDTTKDEAKSTTGQRQGWFGNWLGGGDDATVQTGAKPAGGATTTPLSRIALDDYYKEEEDNSDEHEGLWVTLTPTNMSSSPFFDTLLVLVVSPLVTLTVVYALLLLRSRIRRRRWRAPKSVVERLPVRTYHTISDDTTSTASATPGASSASTPLLQHSPSRPTSSPSLPRSRTASEGPATSSSFQQNALNARSPEEEKREEGLAKWRRRYGGRQKECVVCLEEYVDGVSKVMSLPCGHEFHADCITPWLVTRRRTCPICKGDVVRSLSQSYRDRTSPSETRSAFLPEDLDNLQAQAAETRNDSPSASRPVPISPSGGSDYADDLDADVEANWTDDDEHSGRPIPQNRTLDLSTSLRELSSSVSTTIWRGFDAIRGATGLQSRPSREELDRDR
ncbi:hypothetical protein BDV95DRAFT_601391 [Massariosphaeria phaeospora]|uniref:RING-type E3 ubiquitin transferase n=1 Tax=Massariosphaeria phaeospora TaxID=100035 RepID=A0A7C8IDM0_9PLEO|nr:hypothetical protein BDV95DRAFT_601391 [Massariosphaeria phaeospora]